MTLPMELRWFWTIGAVLALVGTALHPDVIFRIFFATQTVLYVGHATLAWRDYLAWREVWNEEQSKGMPE